MKVTGKSNILGDQSFTLEIDDSDLDGMTNEQRNDEIHGQIFEYLANKVDFGWEIVEPEV